jgi:8-oxo-dGTP diphosphatase
LKTAFSKKTWFILKPLDKLTSSIPEKPVIDRLEVRVVVFSLRDSQLQALFYCSEPGMADVEWELPGNCVLIHQSLEQSASQCLAHFIGLHEAYLEQLYTYGDPGQDPQERVISVVYFAIIPADAIINNEIQPRTKWYPVQALPGLADNHNDILEYALRRLRYKLEYTAVGFELLPEYFTLTELQRTYELILGERLDKRNFRRRILQAGVIEPIGQRQSGEGRPARLYRYRPDAVAEVQARRLFP